MRAMIDQQQVFTRSRIIQRDPAGEAGISVGGHPDNALRRESVVRKGDKVSEARGIES